MGHAKQRTRREDEFTRLEARSDRRDRRQAEVEEKASGAPKSRGLRSQGDVGIIESDGPSLDKRHGRRAEPTRFDAMPIAGHERLPGYDTPVTTRDEDTHYPGSMLDLPAPVPPKAAAGPDAMKIEADQAHDLQQSSEDAVTDAIQDASEEALDEAAFDEHVAASDLPRRSKSEDDEDKQS